MTTILGKIKDIFKGEHKIFACFVTATSGLFILTWIVGPGNTFIHWIRAKMDIAQYEKQTELLRQEIEQMNENIDELEKNKDTLEKFARERFHFAAPGEDVYIIK